METEQTSAGAERSDETPADKTRERIIDAVLEILNAAARALMDLDPDGKQQLAKLEGKVLCLQITAPPITLHLLPTPDGIEFQRADRRRGRSAAPDVTLRGSALAFARLSRQGAAGVLGEGRITLHGDAELGQQFQTILSRFDLDWEELLARAVGDAPARKAGVAARGLARWAAQSAALARENMADCLAEEKRWVVTNLAMERFENAVDRARADVDRLAQRVDRLKRAFDQSLNQRG